MAIDDYVASSEEIGKSVEFFIDLQQRVRSEDALLKDIYFSHNKTDIDYQNAISMFKQAYRYLASFKDSELMRFKKKGVKYLWSSFSLYKAYKSGLSVDYITNVLNKATSKTNDICDYDFDGIALLIMTADEISKYERSIAYNN